MERQVRVEGTATKLPAAEVDAYFASRPRGSQLGAWASQQSQPVESREELDLQYASFERQWPEGTEISTPYFWGGYRIQPTTFEFWQGRIGTPARPLAVQAQPRELAAAAPAALKPRSTDPAAA